MINFSQPASILQNIGIGTGSVVADLGCGSGHYTMCAIDMVGREGVVYAVDVQKDLLHGLHSSVSPEHKSRIEIIHGDIENTNGLDLESHIVDVVLLCNVMFQLSEVSVVLKEVARLLRPRGRLILVDWADSYQGIGPDPSLIMTMSDTEALLQKHGFVIDKTFDAGAHHWGLVARMQN